MIADASFSLAHRAAVTGRGCSATQPAELSEWPGWLEVIDRDGIRFDINRNHPSVKALSERLQGSDAACLRALLAVLESSFPADALYSRMASDLRSSFNGEEASAQLKEAAHCLLEGLDPSSPVRKTLLATLHLIEPFNLHPAATRLIVKELDKHE